MLENVYPDVVYRYHVKQYTWYYVWYVVIEIPNYL
jgi:hypothetical protein